MSHFSCRCERCRSPAEAGRLSCARCGGVLGFSYADLSGPPDPAHAGQWRWWRRLPVPPERGFVTLGEGGTPLLRARTEAPVELWLKDETRNPTGSHKDRALAVAMSAASARGVRRSAVVSAGSTGLAHAAYCARAGIQSFVRMGSDTDPGRAALVAGLGARPVRVAAPIDRVIERLQALGDRGIVHVASTTRRSNPEQAEGCKTIAYEIVASLGRAPDYVLVPTGGGGTVAALHRGFAEEVAAGRIERCPRLVAIVPRHWNGLELALARGLPEPCSVEADGPPPTILGKLCHGCPPDGVDALSAIRASGGTVTGVEDAAAREAQRTVAAGEGLFVEVSSAVVLPALRHLLAEAIIAPGACVVALLCGSGFRELPFVPAAAPAATAPVALADLDSILGADPC